MTRNGRRPGSIAAVLLLLLVTLSACISADKSGCEDLGGGRARYTIKITNKDDKATGYRWNVLDDTPGSELSRGGDEIDIAGNESQEKHVTVDKTGKRVIVFWPASRKGNDEAPFDEVLKAPCSS
jgi:hypothetical protein